jgi:hypothetical protein
LKIENYMKKRELWKTTKKSCRQTEMLIPPPWTNPNPIPIPITEPESEQDIELEPESEQAVDLEPESEQLVESEQEAFPCMSSAQIRRFFANTPSGSLIEVNYVGRNGAGIMTVNGFVSQFNGAELVLLPIRKGAPVLRIPANFICRVFSPL